MTPENFCYWLQGHLELTDTKDLDSNQVDMIKDHLKLVFNKVTPNRYVEYQRYDLTGTPPKYCQSTILNDAVEYSLTPGVSC